MKGLSCGQGRGQALSDTDCGCGCVYYEESKE
jgi:hypothetical protein